MAGAAAIVNDVVYDNDGVYDSYYMSRLILSVESPITCTVLVTCLTKEFL